MQPSISNSVCCPSFHWPQSFEQAVISVSVEPLKAQTRSHTVCPPDLTYLRDKTENYLDTDLVPNLYDLFYSVKHKYILKNIGNRTVLVPIDLYWMDKKIQWKSAGTKCFVINILQNICVQQ